MIHALLCMNVYIYILIYMCVCNVNTHHLCYYKHSNTQFIFVFICYHFIVIVKLNTDIAVCSVLIWDDTKKDFDKKIVLEFTFSQPVVGVRLRKDM